MGDLHARLAADENGSSVVTSGAPWSDWRFDRLEGSATGNGNGSVSSSGVGSSTAGSVAPSGAASVATSCADAAPHSLFSLCDIVARRCGCQWYPDWAARPRGR